jgi:hypothetical protein
MTHAFFEPSATQVRARAASARRLRDNAGYDLATDEVLRNVTELVILDRSDGSVVSRTPIVDDGLLNPVIGPDGSLYIGLSGILSTLAIETRPTTGLLRFVPTRAPVSP